mgnify:FL=1
MFEGIFRQPRLQTNQFLKEHAHLFEGKVINVSGSDDLDKSVSFFEYYFGNYDSGIPYKNYFIGASEYWISNYPNDNTPLDVEKDKLIYLDLEDSLDTDLKEKFDVVFCHTVFEHIFDIFTAFENLCNLSNDIVIFIVPQCQKVHDYNRGYKDYWRFTPFSIEKLFEQNGMKPLVRKTTTGLSSSLYLYYVASKKPKKWENMFSDLSSIESYLNWRNDGSTSTFLSFFHLKIEMLIRKIVKKLSSIF